MPVESDDRVELPGARRKREIDQTAALSGEARSHALRLLWSAAKPDRRKLQWASFGLVIAGLLEALGPIFGKHFIDDYLVPRQLDYPMMGLLLLGLLLSGWAASWLRYAQLLRLADLSMSSVLRLRTRVYGHVLRLPMSHFDRAITGQLVSRITNDTEACKQLYVQVLFEILQSVTVLMGALIAMAWLDWRLMVIVLLLLPAVVLIVWGYQKLSSKAVAASRELRSDLNAQVAESIAGMPVLQASGATLSFLQRFRDTNEAHYRSRLKELRANAWLLRPALDFLNVLLIIGVIAMFGARLDWAGLGVVEVGLVYAFITYIARVVEPLIQITMQFSQLQQSVIAASRVQTLLDVQTDVLRVPTSEAGAAWPDPALARDSQAATPREAGDAAALFPSKQSMRGQVSIKGLSFGYSPGRPVIADINLEVPAGQFFGIVGHTGAGKTSLLSVLLRFYAPDAGGIWIDGQPLESFGEDAFRRAIGIVPQEPFLLAASAYENIDMGRGLSKDAIRSAASLAQADGFIERLESGYETALGEGGARLSSGQKQLIALARALAGAPVVLLLDEATSRIDSETEQAVQTALAALHGKVTVIAIAHRLSTIRNADTIVVLSHGEIREQGTHESLLAIPDGIYQRLHWLQMTEV